MVMIRTEQMRDFKSTLARDFENRLIDHLAAVAPSMSRDDLAAIAKQAAARASELGLSNERSVSLYAELIVSAGEDFEDDPEFGWAKQILRDPGIPGDAKVEIVAARVAASPSESAVPAAATSFSSSRAPGDPVFPCPPQKSSLSVQVVRRDTGASVPGATVGLSGPTPGAQKMPEDPGMVHFDLLNPGLYSVRVSLDGPLADQLGAPSSVPSCSLAGGEHKGVVVTLEPLVWIAVVMVDQEDAPVSGERYRIKLPDGTVKEGRLGADGSVRIGRIPAGNCEVCFPDLDEEAWEPVGAGSSAT